MVLPSTIAGVGSDSIGPFKLAFEALVDRCLIGTKTIVVYDVGVRSEVAQSLLRKHLLEIFHGYVCLGPSLVPF